MRVSRIYEAASSPEWELEMGTKVTSHSEYLFRIGPEGRITLYGCRFNESYRLNQHNINNEGVLTGIYETQAAIWNGGGK